MPIVPSLRSVLRPLRSTSHSASAVMGIGTSQTMKLAAFAVVCERPALMNIGIEKYWIALKPIAWLQMRTASEMQNGSTYLRWKSVSPFAAAASAAFSAASASSAAIISARISFAFASPLFAASAARASSFRPRR